MLCALGALLLFVLLTWQVAAHGPVRALDERLGRAIGGSAFPTAPAEFLADLGNASVALPLLALAVAYAAWRGRRAGCGRAGAENGRTGLGPGEGRAEPSGGGGAGPSKEQSRTARWWLPPLAAALVMGAVPALVVPLKTWLARPGPPVMVAAGVPDGFYPSGHAATAAVAYGAVALLVVRWHPRARWPVALVVGMGNLAVGFGLVRRGYHWPADVAASWCLAVVLLAAWVLVCRTWAPRTRFADGTGAPGACRDQ
ncbi:phosphatase PAP2 family protein [Streptomyces sp. NPDC003077]|uniref:phosphatase PAP2 family protein n=1 Tax=Streptomyces sp. NPDC003077 TaxID=3154443 RepID=UPI0033B2B8F5